MKSLVTCIISANIADQETPKDNHLVGFLLIDIAGLVLDHEDRELLLHPAVAGIVLFTRNYSDPYQLRCLTTSIRKLNPNLLIAVDQEGGRVQRFRESFTTLPSMRHWGEQYAQQPVRTLRELDLTILQMVEELREAGVNINLMPVLDLDFGVSQVIGARSFGPDPALVSQLGYEMLKYLRRNKLLAVAKHFPGHGAVTVDSHFGLPVDERPLPMLLANDMLPYLILRNEIDAIMPAHVIYSAVDRRYPAGFSAIWLQEILRRKLQFKGVIISDDISMQATEIYGDYIDRVALALLAGVDIVSLCNNRDATIKVLQQFSNYHHPESEERIIRYVRKYV